MAIMFAHEEGRRLKVAVVGCGGHAYRSIIPSFDYLAAEIVAFCDADVVRARKYAAHFGAPSKDSAFSSMKELLAANVADAVVMCVGPKQHPDLACEALAAGLHVWMEKPPSENVAGVSKMIAARDASKRFVAVGFKKAFMPVTRKVKEALNSGSYGKMRTLTARYPLGIPADGPRVLAEKQSNNWLGNGVHPLSLLVHLAGRAETVTTHLSPRGGGFVVIQFESGAIACLHDAAGHANSGIMERYEIVCENGHIVCDNNVKLTLHRPGAPFDYGRGFDFTAGTDETSAITYDLQHTLSTLYNKAIFIQGFVQELDHFISACLNNTAPTVGTLEEARWVMECYEAALLSQGKPVRIADLAALQK